MCDGLSHLREACRGADGVLQPFSAQVTKPQVSNEAPPSTVLNCPWPNTNSILPSRGTNSLWPQSWCGLSRRLCGLLRRPICHLRHPKHFVLWLCHREISNPLSKPNKKNTNQSNTNLQLAPLLSHLLTPANLARGGAHVSKCPPTCCGWTRDAHWHTQCACSMGQKRGTAELICCCLCTRLLWHYLLKMEKEGQICGIF